MYIGVDLFYLYGYIEFEYVLMLKKIYIFYINKYNVY